MDLRATRSVVVTIPPTKIDEVRNDCEKWLTGPGMASVKEVWTFASKCSWMGCVGLQMEPFVRQVWALSAPRDAERPELVYVKQFKSAFQWLHRFTTSRPQGLKRTVHDKRLVVGRWLSNLEYVARVS